jgi:hypothetical protein
VQRRASSLRSGWAAMDGASVLHSFIATGACSH